MQDIAGTLLLIGLLFLVIGLISPKKSLFWMKENPTRKKSALIYGGVVVLSFILFGTTVDAKKAQDQDTASAAPNGATTTEKTEEPAEKALTEEDKKRMTAEYEAKYKAQAEEEAKERAAQTVKASQLKSMYADNEVKADKLFKGNTFYVTGTITDISKDIMDDIFVTLDGDDSLRGVRCYFDNEDIAADFTKGQRVTFKGRGDGYVMLDVMMKDCTLVVD
jgi:hypothetical protein